MTTSNKPSAPVAVIGFSDLASPLEPLWPGTHRALLPIAGKAIIVHLIEQLADAGIRHVRIAGSIQQYAVRNRLGGGREWGITVRYSDLHGEDLRAECLAACGECLYLIGDHLLDANFDAIANGAARIDVQSDIGGNEPGLWRLEDGELRGRSLALASDAMTYQNPLLNVADYHYANLRAVRGLLPRLNLPGGKLHRNALADWKSRIAANARLGKDVFIGKHCRVGQLSKLHEDCVLSNGAVIDDGAQLGNVTVLPNCFVGSRMAIRDAVIGPTGILSLDGRYWAVNNRELLDETRDNEEPITGLPSRRLAGLLDGWLAPANRNREATD